MNWQHYGNAGRALLIEAATGSLILGFGLLAAVSRAISKREKQQKTKQQQKKQKENKNDG